MSTIAPLTSLHQDREVEQLQPYMLKRPRSELNLATGLWTSRQACLEEQEAVCLRIFSTLRGSHIVVVISICEVEKKAYVLWLFANMQDGPKSIKTLPVLNWLREKEMHK